MIFLILLLIPTVLAFITFLFSGNKITIKELCLQTTISAVIAGISVLTIYHVNTSDTEIINGVVTDDTTAATFDSKRAQPIIPRGIV